jgi:hypothetical protein
MFRWEIVREIHRSGGIAASGPPDRARGAQVSATPCRWTGVDFFAAWISLLATLLGFAGLAVLLAVVASLATKTYRRFEASEPQA